MICCIFVEGECLNYNLEEYLVSFGTVNYNLEEYSVSSRSQVVILDEINALAVKKFVTYYSIRIF